MDSLSTSTPNSSVFKSISDSPPTHCHVKIESFSLLSEYVGNYDIVGESEDAYKSEEFNAGGYKWKLLIYPKGNKKKMIDDHISVYLQIIEENLFGTNWDVYVDFRVFLLDQNKNIYVVFEDALTRRKCINGDKFDVGFDKLVPLDEFHDPSYGYLFNDKCVFGADIFVCKDTRRGTRECVSRLPYPTIYKNVWNITNFSGLTDLYYTSAPFVVEGRQWIIKLYPKGENQRNQRTSANRGFSTYLQLVDGKTAPPTTKVFTEFSTRILLPNFSRSGTAEWCFSADKSGYGFYWDVKMLVNGAQVLDLDTFDIETTLTIKGTTSRPYGLKE